MFRINDNLTQTYQILMCVACLEVQCFNVQIRFESYREYTAVYSEYIVYSSWVFND